MRVAINWNLATFQESARLSHGMVRKVWAGDVSTFCLASGRPIREPCCSARSSRSAAIPQHMRAKGWILEINPRGKSAFTTGTRSTAR